MLFCYSSVFAQQNVEMQKIIWTYSDGRQEYSQDGGRTILPLPHVKMEKVEWTIVSGDMQKKRSKKLLSVAAAPSIVWENTYAAELNDTNTTDFLKATQFIETGDGGFVANGPISAGAGTGIIKVDKNGMKMWKVIYKSPVVKLGNPTFTPGLVEEKGNSVFFTGIWSNTSFIPSGYLFQSEINQLGDTLWSRYEYSEAGWLESSAPELVRLPDNSYILSYGGIALRKTDEMGKKIWSKGFVGEGGERRSTAAVCVTKDKGYIILGNADQGKPPADILIIKTDANGEKQWEKIYKTPDNDIAEDIREVEGGFVILRTANSSSPKRQYMKFTRIDDKGEVVWEKTVSEAEITYGKSLAILTDGTIVGGGYAAEYKAADFKGEGDPATYDFYLAALTPSGEPLWTKRWGDSELNNLEYILQTKDGLLAVGGLSANKMYLAKLVLSPTGVEGESFTKPASFTASPNPAQNSFTVRYSSEGNAPVTFALCDGLGRTLEQKNGEDGTVEFLTENLPNGVYFLKLNNGLRRETQKVIIAR